MAVMPMAAPESVAPKRPKAKREASATDAARRSKQRVGRNGKVPRRDITLDEVMTPNKISYDLVDLAVRRLNALLREAGKGKVKVSRGGGRGYDEIRKDVDREWRALLGESGTVTIGDDAVSDGAR